MNREVLVDGMVETISEDLEEVIAELKAKGHEIFFIPVSLETLIEWDKEGYCEATDGCIVKPDGICPHGCKSWQIEMGFI